MTAAQAESLDTKGVRSLEVRWILPGQLTAGAADWFGRFPAETRVVEDTYLLDPHLPGLSVKVRGGRALEVKMYCGSPGLLKLAGRAHGRLESWHKWSFPHEPAGPGSSDPAGWRPVSKRRRISWFSQATGVGVLGPGEEARCAVELTEFDVRGKAWWTLGFEATGPPICSAANSSGRKRARCCVTDMRMSDGLPVIHRWAAPGRRRRLVPAATQDPRTRQSA